jgi:hypothetical protein
MEKMLEASVGQQLLEIKTYFFDGRYGRAVGAYQTRVSHYLRAR